MPPPLILDGRTLARRRTPSLRRRAKAVHEARGAAPRLLLLAFRDSDGHVPWIAPKLRACEAAGIDVALLPVDPELDTERALGRLADDLTTGSADGVFVQFPFPPSIDGAALARGIPLDADVDVMNPEAIARLLDGAPVAPPLTIRAILLLLDAYGVAVGGERAIVVGDETSFNLMCCAALVREGAVASLVLPDAPERSERLRGASVVVASLSRVGALPAADLAEGAVAVDGGYFNPGGRGDIDTAGGIQHLRAFAPVPGGVGPMTVSALVEAVIERAEDEGD